MMIRILDKEPTRKTSIEESGGKNDGENIIPRKA
jgi:hypothetical protein